MPGQFPLRLASSYVLIFMTKSFLFLLSEHSGLSERNLRVDQYFSCLIYFLFTRARHAGLRGEASASRERSEIQNGWETNAHSAAILARCACALLLAR